MTDATSTEQQDSPPVRGFLPKEDQERRYQALLDKGNKEIDWTKLHTTSIKPKEIKIIGAEGTNAHSLLIARQTIAQVGSVVGIFEPWLPDSKELIVEPTVYLVQPSELEDEHMRAQASHGKFLINKEILDPEVDAKANADIIKNALGPETSIDSPEAQELVEIMLEGTIAHELYHFRQNQILFWRKERNRNKYKSEEKPVNEEISKWYKFDDDERGARAFEIKYHREILKTQEPNSSKAQILKKYVDYLTKRETDINAELKTLKSTYSNQN